MAESKLAKRVSLIVIGVACLGATAVTCENGQRAAAPRSAANDTVQARARAPDVMKEAAEERLEQYRKREEQEERAAAASAPAAREAPPPPPAPSPLSGNSPTLQVGENGPRVPTYWNSWMKLDTQHEPRELSDELDVNTNYRLYISLAGYDYRTAKAYSHGVSESLVNTNMDAVLANQKKKTISLQVIISPDPRFFSRVGSAVWEQSMQFPVKQLKQGFAALDDDPFNNDNASYDFARIPFKLKTKDIGEDSVAASIAVFILDANGAPLDEFEVWHCISKADTTASCKLPDPTGTGAASDLAPAMGATIVPDATLSAVELGNGRVSAIFRRKEDNIHSVTRWELPPFEKLRTSVVATLKRLNEWARMPAPNDPVADSSNLAQLSVGLSNALFPPGAAGAGARARFTKFIVDASAASPKPTLAARLVPTFPFPFPLSAVEDKNGKRVFVGDAVNVFMPLDLPPVRASTNPCQLRWLSVRPPPLLPAGTASAVAETVLDDSLDEARRAIDQYHEPLLELLRQPSTFFEMPKFGEYMENPKDDPPEPRTALVIMSHHVGTDGDDVLYFDQRRTADITPALFSREFTRPSIAVVNACGTGTPTSSQLVERLSAEGFSSIITTALEVDQTMAAEFLHCLAQQLAAATRPKPIGELFGNSVTCLRQFGKGKFGQRVLAYSLLGDADVPVCPLPAPPP